MLFHLLLATAVAWAQPPGPFLDSGMDTGAPPSATHGTCPSVVLRDGVQLPEMPGLIKRWHPENEWGTPEMIEVITSAAEEMAWLLPEADPLVVGDISAQHGGFLAGHKSHRGGMDADIGLYYGNAHQHQQGFMVVPPYDLDAQANWFLIRAMLNTGMVDRILLDTHLIDVLRRYVVQTGELSPDEANAIFPPLDTPAVWNLHGVVHHAVNHKHHMHVRVACPTD